MGRRWIAHERVGPLKFDAASVITALDPPRSFEWVSYPPMKDTKRGTGGTVEWGYLLEPDGEGTHLIHFMKVLEPRRGAGPLKLMYAVVGLRKKQRAGGLATLTNIKAAVESEHRTR